MHSVFGWSYPPGCSGPPDHDLYCDVCGRSIDNCICPECPECGEFGNPKCYSEHGLILNKEQYDSKVKADKMMKEFIEKENALWDNI